ncbi:MAG TPA: hypothetical protein VKE40_06150 [Gemmataceae bacterium]|nr:hypothetical protein [Gemmataceae bacterium]
MAENVFDQAARYLAKIDPTAVLNWALPATPSPLRFIRWLDARTVPFPGSPHRVCDTVAHLEQVDPPGRPWAIPVECQVEPDPEMFGRLLEYLGRLWRAERPSPERGDRFWLGAVVINLTGTGRSSRDHEWTAVGLRTQLRVVERNLHQESASSTLARVADGTLGTIILGLVPLMDGGDDSGIMTEWLRLASTEADPRRRSDIGALALVFAEAANRGSAWMRLLKGWNMIQSKQVLEWQAEGEARGKASAVVAFLEARFQVVPADLIAAIQGISDLHRLNPMVKLAATAVSLDQFRTDAGL